LGDGVGVQVGQASVAEDRQDAFVELLLGGVGRAGMVALPAWPPGVADVLAERLLCCVAQDQLLVECRRVEPAGVQVAFDGLGFGLVGVDAG